MRGVHVRQTIALLVVLACWYGMPAASAQKPVQAPQPPPSPVGPPPTDNPAEADVADLANAAYDAGMASLDGEIIALASGSYADWVEAQLMCEYFGISPCPPIDDGAGPADPPKDKPEEKPKEGSTATQNVDVIPIKGDSSTPVDEVVGGEPEPVESHSGPFVPELFLRPADAAEPLPQPVLLLNAATNGDMEMRVYSPNALSLQARRDLLHMRGIAAPLIAAASRRIAARLGTPGTHLTRVPMRGYCVEAMKAAPAKGAMYVFAPKAYQQQFAPAGPVREIAEFAGDHGYLRPQGDPAAYRRFVTQYAIWTKVAHWDRDRFMNEFVRRSRGEMKAANKTWTNETEQTLRALAPARWRDVQLVIRAADAVRMRTRTLAGGTQ